MPSLRCPQCGYSDLHAVDVETVQPNLQQPEGLKRDHQHELACKRCGWTPTKDAHPKAIVGIEPIDNNT